MKYRVLSYLIFSGWLIFALEPGRPFNYNLEGDEHKTLQQMQHEAWKEMSPEAKEERQLSEQRAKIKEYKSVASKAAQKGAARLSDRPSSKTPDDAGFKMDFSEDDEKKDLENERLAKEAKAQEEYKPKEVTAKNFESKKVQIDFSSNSVKPANSKDVASWTTENIKNINPEDFKKLKTADLIKLLEKPEIVKELSQEQVQAIDPKELSGIIDEGKGFWKGLFGSSFKFPDSFVKNLSGDQINQLFADHTGNLQSWFKNFDSHFSPEMKKEINKRQEKYIAKENKALDDARLFAQKEDTIQILKEGIEDSVAKMTKYIEDVQTDPDLSKNVKEKINEIVQYAIYKKKYGSKVADYLKKFRDSSKNATASELETLKIDLYDTYWHYQEYTRKKAEGAADASAFSSQTRQQKEQKNYNFMVNSIQSFMQEDFENTIYKLVFGQKAAEFLKNIQPGAIFAKGELPKKAKEFLNLDRTRFKGRTLDHDFQLAAERKAHKN